MTEPFVSERQALSCHGYRQTLEQELLWHCDCGQQIHSQSFLNKMNAYVHRTLVKGVHRGSVHSGPHGKGPQYLSTGEGPRNNPILGTLLSKAKDGPLTCVTR